MIEFEHIGQVARDAALKAGKILQERFHGAFSIFSKGRDHDLVTEVDLACEKAILETIRTSFPHHNILAEESGVETLNPDAPTWVIDPLDGTLNFVRGIPSFSVSIGVFYKKEMMSGVVYQPITNELFFAVKDRGAFCNDTKISVSKVDAMKNALLVTGIPYHSQDKPHRSVSQFAKMLSLGCPIRDLGSCAIDVSYLAAGRFDGYWMPTVLPWDIAGALCILNEAGGKLTLYDGSSYDELVPASLIASNGLIHQQLVEKLAS
jgi:myo-inositol-1(or 4)-monophosphatase